ncbi:ATP-binding protein [Nonomuraea deserti]|nr:ATP-binding protein [Nonomuraea deserti]
MVTSGNTFSRPDERDATWTFASDASSIPGVRKAVRDELAAWGLRSIAADAELLVSEVVTNAVQHAQGPYRCSVWLTGAFLRFEVEDRTAAPPLLRDAGFDAERGRGLRVLDAIACCWGSEDSPLGKIVWFELLAGAGL